MEKIVPELGIHAGIPNNVYHQSWDAVNNSSLKDMARCPAQYQYKRANPDDPDKDCFRIGSAVDCLLLTPELFDEEFDVMADVSFKTKEGRLYRDNFIEQVHYNGNTWLTASEFNYCAEMAEAARNSPLYEKHLAGGEAQLSLVWDDPETGIRCKCRMDNYNANQNIIWDLKSTKEDVENFGKAVANFDYLFQAPFYAWGVFCVTGKMPDFGFYVVGKDEPHFVMGHKVPRDYMQAGLERIRRVMHLLKQCRDTDTWPGFDYVVPLSIPKYYEDRITNS